MINWHIDLLCSCGIDIFEIISNRKEDLIWEQIHQKCHTSWHEIYSVQLKISKKELKFWKKSNQYNNSKYKCHINNLIDEIRLLEAYMEIQ